MASTVLSRSFSNPESASLTASLSIPLRGLLVSSSVCEDRHYIVYCFKGARMLSPHRFLLLNKRPSIPPYIRVDSGYFVNALGY